MRIVSTFACLLPLVAMPADAAVSDDSSPHEISLPAKSGTLRAYLFRPEGAGQFPVVVAMHDCDGLGSASNAVRPSYREWAQHFNEAGFAVLFPDSFGSRELGSQCRAADRVVQASREGVADVLAARQWLLDQDWVMRSRLTVVGWGLGGNAVLWAVRPQANPQAGPQISLAASSPDFRSAAVLYPSCQRPSRLGWSSRVPTLVLTGSKGDVAATRACQQMVANAKGRSALAQFRLYPELDRNAEQGATQTADASGNTSVVRSLTATAEGPKRVLEWLAR